MFQGSLVAIATPMHSGVSPEQIEQGDDHEDGKRNRQERGDNLEHSRVPERAE